MKNFLIKWLGHSKAPYIALSFGCALLIVTVSAGYLGALRSLTTLLLVISVVSYSVAWIANVFQSRKQKNNLILETRSLNKKLEDQTTSLNRMTEAITKHKNRSLEQSKSAAEAISKELAQLLTRIEVMEENWKSSLSNTHSSSMKEYEKQSFNSYLAMQELRSLIIEDRNSRE